MFKVTMSSISKQLENGVATLTLNRPEVFNSFNREMALLLQKELDACAENSEVRAIVITGSGKASVSYTHLTLPTNREV